MFVMTLGGISAAPASGHHLGMDDQPFVDGHDKSYLSSSGPVSPTIHALIEQSGSPSLEGDHSLPAADIYLAAPENLNPGLFLPPPDPVPLEPVPTESLIPEEDLNEEPVVPFWQIQELTINTSDSFTNFGQNNRMIEPSVTGLLPNGDRLSFSTGVNTFDEPNQNLVLNIPLTASWTRTTGKVTTTVGGGIDIFDNIPITPNFHASASRPIGRRANLSFVIEHGPYKFNATTLNNRISSWRYGPNIYWQISPSTSLFSLLRLGHYNDGNFEQQSFSRLEQRIGDFSVAANVFNWVYQEDAEMTSGYFSPDDFLVVNGEVAWQDDIFDWLDCRVAGSWGQQRLAGEWTSAFEYGAQCSVPLVDSFDIDFGYTFSNVVSETGGSAFNNRSFTGQIRSQF